MLPTFFTSPQLVTAVDGTLLLIVIGQPCNHTNDCTNVFGGSDSSSEEEDDGDYDNLRK